MDVANGPCLDAKVFVEPGLIVAGFPKNQNIKEEKNVLCEDCEMLESCVAKIDVEEDL